MRVSMRALMLTATCLAVVLSSKNARSPAFAGQTAIEPLSRAYRITRASDVEFQKIEPFKVFDNPGQTDSRWRGEGR